MTERPEMIIDFNDIEGKVLTGRSRGESLRKHYDLPSADRDDVTVCVKVPGRVYTLSSSFFLGMFGPSVIAAGSAETFFTKYHFSASPTLKEAFSDYVSRALREKNLFNNMH